MVKSIVSVLISVAILFSWAFAEQKFIEKTFSDFSNYMEETEIKLEKNNFSKEDSTALEKFWMEKKKYLHMWISHNEIKEIDLWVSECIGYTKQNNFKEAILKIQVLKTLASEIPKTFMLSYSNIF